ncbi:MAG: hypothetical protein HYV52_01270 [Parcubacteria group bacterium]|nr:hypothetical protein [Parcubacteria group bacterium]
MNKSKNIICLAIISLGLFGGAGFASAAAQITNTGGAFVHNGIVTIAGSGFGTKAIAAPLWWDDAETGTVAANYNSVIGNNVYATGPNQISAVSTRFLQFESFANYGTRWASKPVGQTLNHTIAFFKWKWDPNFTFDTSGGTGNEKIFMWGDNWDGAPPNFALDARHELNKIYLGNLSPETSWGNFSALKDKWYDFKVILDIDYNNGVYGANGSAYIYMDNVLISSGTGLRFADTNAPGIQEPHIGGWVGAAAAGGATGRPDDITYADNIYIDNTWARAEIGNAPTLAASTIREVQIPLAWSDTSITITINQGNLEIQNNAYLYVFDANGNVNANGYLLTTPDTAPPSAPTGLAVN